MIPEVAPQYRQEAKKGEGMRDWKRREKVEILPGDALLDMEKREKMGVAEDDENALVGCEFSIFALSYRSLCY